MIKFRSDKLIGLGLSKMNLLKLKEGKPILIEGSELGIDYDIFIMYGNTERQILLDMKKAGLINEGTPITPTASCD